MKRSHSSSRATSSVSISAFSFSTLLDMFCPWWATVPKEFAKADKPEQSNNWPFYFVYGDEGRVLMWKWEQRSWTWTETRGVYVFVVSRRSEYQEDLLPGDFIWGQETPLPSVRGSHWGVVNIYTHTHTHTHTHPLLNDPLRNPTPPSPHPLLTQTMPQHTHTHRPLPHIPTPS